MRNILLVFALILTIGFLSVDAQEATPTPVPTHCFENGLCVPLPTLAPTMDPWATYVSPTPTEVLPTATLGPTEPPYVPPGYPAPGDTVEPPYPAPLIAQVGNCNSGWVAKDESAPFTYDGGELITKVIVKSGQGCFVFLRNGSNGCYAVSGMPEGPIKVNRVGDAGPSCQEISHVEFYATVNTPTPTDGNIPRNTPTPTQTATLPFKFWTFTPSPSETPTGTTTPPVETVTPTLPGETRTPEGPTDTPTQPPERTKVPPKHRTSTPEVLLPAAGEAPLNSGSNWLGPILAGGIILAYLVVTALLRLYKRDEYEITRELEETRDRLRDQIWGDDD